jgi:hypothetical protein
MFCQKCGTENKDGATFCNSCGVNLLSEIVPSSQIPVIQSKEDKKEIKLKIAAKKTELAGLTNGGAWVLIIVGLITTIIGIGIVLIIIGLYIMHTNSKKNEKLTKEIAELEAELD